MQIHWAYSGISFCHCSITVTQAMVIRLNFVFVIDILYVYYLLQYFTALYDYFKQNFDHLFFFFFALSTKIKLILFISADFFFLPVFIVKIGLASISVDVS